MANFMQMMQKANQMKSRMQDMQDRARDMVLTGASGGQVTCQMNGKFEVTKISIDPAATADVEMLEDMVLAAIGDARQQAEKHMTEETEKIMRELGLPAGMGLPF